jgi:hypothetical protein
MLLLHTHLVTKAVEVVNLRASIALVGTNRLPCKVGVLTALSSLFKGIRRQRSLRTTVVGDEFDSH